jgi:hypothetical protein
VDLTSIDGIDVMTALTIVSEIGTDMSRFKDEDHFASWLGLTPSKDVSGGKTVGRGKRKVKNRLAVVLRTAATTLLRSDTYLGARYRNLRRQLPSLSAAVKAMGRHLAVLTYRLLTKGEAWVDRGATQFERRRTEQELANLNFRAKLKVSSSFRSPNPAKRITAIAADPRACNKRLAVVCSIRVRRAAFIPINPKKPKPTRTILLSPRGSFWRASSPEFAGPLRTLP